MTRKIILIKDTREKNGWELPLDGSVSKIVSQGLSEGDYTSKRILDTENKEDRKILRIERKASTGELSQNLGKKKRQFFAEIERLKEYEEAYIICEFPLVYIQHFPKFSGIPQYLWYRKGRNGRRVKNIKITGNYMMRCIEEIQNEHKIPILFFPDKALAQQAAYEIIREAENRLTRKNR